MPNWKAVLAGVGCFLLWSALVAEIGHNKGFSAGEKSGNAKAQEAERKQHGAEVQTQLLVDKLNEISLQAQHEAVEAAKQKELAARLTEQLAQEKADHAKADAAWQKKFKDLGNKPDCATLKALICESAMDY